VPELDQKYQRLDSVQFREHVIHGARSSGTRDGSISPPEDRIFLRFTL